MLVNSGYDLEKLQMLGCDSTSEIGTQWLIVTITVLFFLLLRIKENLQKIINIVIMSQPFHARSSNLQGNFSKWKSIVRYQAKRVYSSGLRFRNLMKSHLWAEIQLSRFLKIQLYNY